MGADPLDRIARTAFLSVALLFLLGGAGWAWYGTDIFLTMIMAGLAYCF